MPRKDPNFVIYVTNFVHCVYCLLKMWQKTTGNKVLCVYIVREKFKITFNINFAW